jgi:hypothetical protein
MASSDSTASQSVTASRNINVIFDKSNSDSSSACSISCFQRCNAKLSAAVAVTFILALGLLTATLDIEELCLGRGCLSWSYTGSAGGSAAATAASESHTVTENELPLPVEWHDDSNNVMPPIIQQPNSQLDVSQSTPTAAAAPSNTSEHAVPPSHQNDVIGRRADSLPQSKSGQPTRFQARSSLSSRLDTSITDAISDDTPFEKRFPSLWTDFDPSAAKYPKGFKPVLPTDVGLKPTPVDESLPYVVSDEQYLVHLAPQLLKHRKNPYVCLARPMNDCLRTLLYQGASHPSIADVCKGFAYTTAAHFNTSKDLPSASKTGDLSKHWDDYICATNGKNSDTFCSYNPATLMIDSKPPAKKAVVQDVLNVVAIQIDAISRTRFRYLYPETAKYLENMNDRTSTEAQNAFSRAFDFPYV